ncbi:MAG: SDR family oxidoreductase [Bdellovibrionales bacterium]|nr:SDR family oxidoreductase [Bdellovibrionales bacterium]
MRIALITGGTSGIGRGITEQYLSEDYFVYCVGLGTAHIIECKNEITSESITYLQGDLSQEDFAQDVASTIEKTHGKLDVLVNAAGVYLGSGGIDEPVERWRQMLDINLIGLFAITHKCYPLLKKGAHPSIINISSVCSLHPYSSCTSTCYSVSKAGVDLFTKRLAKELAKDHIRVNAINPGVVTSNIWQRCGTQREDHEEWKERMRDERHPLGRTGEPQDIAHLASFLASSKSEWMTGSIIPLDGGYSVTS